MENNTVETTEKEEKVPMTTKQKVFFGLRIAGNVVFYAIIIALFLFAIFNINGGNGTEDFPHIFGSGFLSVQSESMQHDESKETLAEWANYPISDGFNKGDLLRDSVASDSKINALKIGDVITFTGDADNDGVADLNTHRIVDISYNADGTVAAVTTQGDARAQSNNYYGDSRVKLCAYLVIGSDRANATGMSDSEIAAFDYYLETNKYIENVSADSIRGIVKSVTAGGGSVLDNIQKNYLFYFVLPVAVLLIIEIFLVVRNIMIYRGEKNKAELAGSKEAMMADLEAEKEKMRQELLAEMRAQGLVSEEKKPEESVAEEPKEEVTSEDAPETTEAPEDKTAESETPAEEKKSEE